MNVLPSASTGPLPPSPSQAPAEVLPVRALDGGSPRREPYRGPQGSRQEQDQVVDRLRNTAERDQGLSLQGRRAVSAYSAHSQDEERSYMRQVLGFEFRI